MDDYLIDRETLGQFVDELIKQKALDVENTEELNELREKSIKELDDKIGMAIFGRLNNEQWAEFEQLLEKDNIDSEEQNALYDAFFAKYGINEEEIMTDAMKEYATEFLGGQNA